MEGLVGTKFFGEIEPYIKIEVRKSAQPGRRIELESWTPADIRRRALDFEMLCVARCGRQVHPFRPRDGNTANIYYAPCCPLSVNVGCSRGKAARDEYDRVAAAVKPRKAQGNLFS